MLLQNDLAQGNLSSDLPDTVPIATALGSAAILVLHLQGGAGPQQQRDHLDVAALCGHMQRRLASGRRPRGEASEGGLLENSQAAQAAHPENLIVQQSNTNMLTPSDKRMPGETQATQGRGGSCCG